jgi:hypothetical protein
MSKSTKVCKFAAESEAGRNPINERDLCAGSESDYGEGERKDEGHKGKWTDEQVNM